MVNTTRHGEEPPGDTETRNISRIRRGAKTTQKRRQNDPKNEKVANKVSTSRPLDLKREPFATHSGINIVMNLHESSLCQAFYTFLHLFATVSDLSNYLSTTQIKTPYISSSIQTCPSTTSCPKHPRLSPSWAPPLDFLKMPRKKNKNNPEKDLKGLLERL